MQAVRLIPCVIIKKLSTHSGTEMLKEELRLLLLGYDNV